MKNLTVRRLTMTALLAAVYAALTMGLGFISYESVQFRIAEALCVLPFFFPWTTWGLFLGCVIANLLSPAGVLDVVFGSLATLLSCLAVAALGRGDRRRWVNCVFACLMPVLCNALVVGAVITFALTPALASSPVWLIFLVNALSVGAGEAVVLFALGLPLLRFLPKSRVYPLLQN